MKAFKSLVLATLITTSLSTKAAVGFPLASPLIVGAGVVVIVGGGSAAAMGVSDIKKDNTIRGALLTLGGIAMAGFGLFILEGEQKITFAELSSDQGEKLGLSALEVQTYNEELDQVNALNTEVTELLSSLQNPTEKDSVEAWMNVKDAVSLETFKAMGKILMFAQR